MLWVNSIVIIGKADRQLYPHHCRVLSNNICNELFISSLSEVRPPPNIFTVENVLHGRINTIHSGPNVSANGIHMVTFLIFKLKRKQWVQNVRKGCLNFMNFTAFKNVYWSACGRKVLYIPNEKFPSHRSQMFRNQIVYVFFLTQ